MPDKGDYDGKGGALDMKDGRLMTGNAAAAWGARLSSVDYIPAYPITPQTEIIETLSEWIRKGEMDARLVQLESEHSMLTAAGSAASTGARVFTATSSQGLLYGMEMLYNISGWRAPLVLVNVSRALAAPITLEPDHNDVLAARDSGFLQFHAENCQEIADMVIMAYRLAEDRKVVLPVIVNLDGFYLSFTRERVLLPDERTVREFLPDYAGFNPFRATRPVAKGSSVMTGHLYSYFRYQMHTASLNALTLFPKIAEEFSSLFGRSYGPVEEFMMDDAEYVLVMTNSFSTIGRQAVKRLRSRGVKAGLLKIRMLRPFPAESIAGALSGRKAVTVFDQNIAPGAGGIIYPEVVSALYHRRDRPENIYPVIGGLGGKQITIGEMEMLFDLMRSGRPSDGEIHSPLYLLRDDELQAVKKNLRIAGMEVKQ